MKCVDGDCCITDTKCLVTAGVEGWRCAYGVGTVKDFCLTLQKEKHIVIFCDIFRNLSNIHHTLTW